jgi:hypothetical protein
MYFELSKNKNLDYSKFYQIKNYILSTDLGWKEIQGLHGKIIYKGYADVNLENFLKNCYPANNEMPNGSFTAIMETASTIYIKHDRSRSYPIFIDDDRSKCTNLTRHKTIIWPDTYVFIDCDSDIIKTKYVENEFEKKQDVSFNETCDSILSLLNKNINHFASNHNMPIKVVPTGGVDSTLLIGLLKHNNLDFEIINYEHKDWTYFYKKNRLAVSENIGNMLFIKIGHTWGTKPTVLANGWHGDQHFFRDYLPLAVLCKAKNIDLPGQAQKYKGAYAHQFILDEMNDRQEQHEQITKNIIDVSSAYKKIFEIIIASFQCWHFEETIYWSPFKNIEITKSILQMSDKDIIDNAFMASVQKKLIEKVDPNLLDVITNQKNFFDQKTFDKFTSILSQY